MVLYYLVEDTETKEIEMVDSRRVIIVCECTDSAGTDIIYYDSQSGRFIAEDYLQANFQFLDLFAAMNYLKNADLEFLEKSFRAREIIEAISHVR